MHPGLDHERQTVHGGEGDESTSLGTKRHRLSAISRPGKYHGFGSKTQNKVNMEKNRFTQMFRFLSVHKSYVYTVLSIKRTITFCPEDNVHTLILKYFIAQLC